MIPAFGRRKHRIVQAMGTPVKAKVTEVRLDHSTSVNGRNPWVVVTEYQDDELNRKLVFTSQYLWSNPQADYPVGSDVRVTFLPQSVRSMSLTSIGERGPSSRMKGE